MPLPPPDVAVSGEETPEKTLLFGATLPRPPGSPLGMTMPPATKKEGALPEAYDDLAAYLSAKSMESLPPGSRPALVTRDDMGLIDRRIEHLTTTVVRLDTGLRESGFVTRGELEALREIVRSVANTALYDTERSRVDMRALKDAVRALDERRGQFEGHATQADKALALAIAKQSHATARLTIWKWVAGSFGIAVFTHILQYVQPIARLLHATLHP